MVYMKLENRFEINKYKLDGKWWGQGWRRQMVSVERKGAAGQELVLPAVPAAAMPLAGRD